MKTIENWEKIKERYLEWWNHEETDRCMIFITGPNENAKKIEPPKVPDIHYERYYGFDYMIDYTDYVHKTTYYVGDAFPTWPETLVPLYMFNMLDDVNVEEGIDTLWQKPVMLDEHLDYRKIKFDPNNKYYRFALDLYKLALERCKDNSIPLVHGYHSVADVTAAFRGTEQMLLDLYDIPEEIIAAEDYFCDIGVKIYNDIMNVVEEGGTGYTNFVRAWCPGSFSMCQHDFAYMISQSMFDEIFLPALKKQLSNYKYSLHHVDGEGNFKHVPSLCEIKELTGMQILPGEGKPSPLHYIDTLKYVQGKGKNLQITIAPEEVERALELLSPKGLLITTSCASEDDAKALLKLVEKKSLKGIYR